MTHIRDLPLTIAIVAIIAISIPAPVIAQDESSSKIDGIFYLTENGCGTDPSATCVFNAQLQGGAAKVLYENMKSAPKPDACVDGLVKSDDDKMICYKSDIDHYQCFFGYDFAKKQIVRADFSC